MRNKGFQCRLRHHGNPRGKTRFYYHVATEIAALSRKAMQGQCTAVCFRGDALSVGNWDHAGETGATRLHDASLSVRVSCRWKGCEAGLFEPSLT